MMEDIWSFDNFYSIYRCFIIIICNQPPEPYTVRGKILKYIKGSKLVVLLGDSFRNDSKGLSHLLFCIRIVPFIEISSIKIIIS